MFKHRWPELGARRAQAALASLEAQHQGAMAAGTERLEGVLRDKAALNAKWDEQNHALVDGHERVVHEVTVEFEAKLAVRAAAVTLWHACDRSSRLKAEKHCSHQNCQDMSHLAGLMLRKLNVS